MFYIEKCIIKNTVFEVSNTYFTESNFLKRILYDTYNYIP